jgi:hypothetical protein
MLLEELEGYFKTVEVPESAKIDQDIMVTDVPRFMESHLTILRNYGSKPVYNSFYDRLLSLKAVLESKPIPD